MKKEEPKEYYERNVLLVAIVLIVGLFLDYLSVSLLIDVNPWGAATAIPGLILTLQGLWLLVNPYAIVYNDRFEIKQSLIHSKIIYYLDLKDIDALKHQVVYNDEDRETLRLTGIRASHKNSFFNKIKEHVEISLKNRHF